MIRQQKQFKEGAASFFIVAISTMILMIIVTSFAAIMISEITRSSNDDLSQSAYDSAMAGVEDAKLAFANYRKCLESGATADRPSNYEAQPTCDNIVWMMERENTRCDMVAYILGRVKDADGSVPVSDKSGDTKSNYNQAYTCVTMEGNLTNYRASLDSTTSEKIVKVSLDDSVAASRIKKVRIKWYSQRGGETYNYTNFSNNKVVFSPTSLSSASVPPTLQVQLIQTAGTFSISHFEAVDVGGNKTDRATMYLVPTDNAGAAKATNADSYKGIYNGSANVLSAAQVVSTNNRDSKNLPFVVYCSGADDYACVVDILLPDPIGGARSSKTFLFVVTTPYGQPATDFEMEFYCADNDVCSRQLDLATGTEKDSSIANLKGMQVNVDSTGRANDLYRRVEVRLEATNTSFKFPMYGIQLLNSSNGDNNLDKNFSVQKEWNF
ncbi:hypothetical protein IKW73_01440 [Candidatus Saccharibacteria bacterium]|nr:hypothetical protein [Candidatus Saccharibacteria bacterium]